MLDRTSFLREMTPEAGTADRRRNRASGFSFGAVQAEVEQGAEQSARGEQRVRHPMAAGTKPVAGSDRPPQATSAAAVPEFQSWFQTVEMCAGQGLSGGYTIRRANCASAEGAAEALRLVQRFAPGARIETDRYAGAWTPDKPIYEIALPDGSKMNAGLILDRYYQHGAGPHGLSDADLAEEIGLLMDQGLKA